MSENPTKPQPTYREQPGCHSCRHRFLYYEWDEDDEYFCTLNASPRPKCDSTAMGPEERWGAINPHPENPTYVVTAWEAWRKAHAVQPWGICDGWEVETK